MSQTEPANKPPLRNRVLLGAGIVATLGLAIAFGLSLGNAGAPSDLPCDPQPAVAKAIDAAAQGELAALNGTGTGRGYADLAFTDAQGNKKTVGDFAGKALLVNFWASWCIPCREEMPALNILASQQNDAGFEVLPINLDIGADGLDKAKAFLAEGNWPNLPLYADNTFQAFERLKGTAVAIGLPTTILLDSKGCEVGVLPGPAHWDTPDGTRVIEALKGLAA